MITIDTESGFCFGVTSAIQKAEEELKKGSLSCLGDIVHNGQEVARLEQAGLKTIDYDEFQTMQGGRVLLRAHGEPPSTYLTAANNHIEIIDATCPVVLMLQKRIRQCYQDHPQAQIVIYGQRGHAEVIGLMGQTANTALVIERIEDLSKIDFTRDIYLFSQTTKSVDEFNEIVREIQSSITNHQSPIHFESYDTICRNVANRVARLKEFAQSQDLVIFVGGKKSSNAKVLFEHCHDANSNSIFISSPDEINDELRIMNYDLKTQNSKFKIGICGATSTPLWLMEQCKQKIEQICTKLKQ